MKVKAEGNEFHVKVLPVKGYNTDKGTELTEQEFTEDLERRRGIYIAEYIQVLRGIKRLMKRWY